MTDAQVPPPVPPVPPVPQSPTQASVPPFSGSLNTDQAIYYPQTTTPGYQQPTYPQAGFPQAGAPRKSGLGIVAFFLALSAFLIPSILGAANAFAIGLEIGEGGLYRLTEYGDLNVLMPVRNEVLWIEVAFWFGTVIGIWAFIQGIVAIAKRRGRGLGIAAAVIAFFGPGSFFFAALMGLSFGIAATMPL